MSNENFCAISSHQRICNEVGGDSYTEWYNKRVKTSVVVTFVWRDMNQKEWSSFRQGVKVLGKHPFVVVHPKGYSVEYLKQRYAEISSIELADEHFQSIESYHQMMLSPWFYDLFKDYDYMLIYQIDAYVFSDQLDYWTMLGYDYIGSPWMLNDNLYQRLIGKRVTRLLQRIPIRNNNIHSAHLFHRVGSGGFSLRRVAKMAEMMERSQNFISSIRGKYAQQEDVLISILLKEREHLKIPSWRLAIYFSFEKAPAWCLEFTNGAFPFGCHNLNNRYWDSFWKYYIPLQPSSPSSSLCEK